MIKVRQTTSIVLKCAICMLVADFIIAVTYYMGSNTFNGKLGEMIWITLLGDPSLYANNNILLSGLLVLNRFIKILIEAYLTGAFFAIVVKRSDNILLSNNLKIRRRTTRGSGYPLTISCLVGNKGRKCVYDVECKLTCFYVKDDGEINAEHVLRQSCAIVENFFRFSFNLSDLPEKLLRDYIDANEDAVNRDRIIISVSGKDSFINDTFIRTHSYRLSDIHIDDGNRAIKTLAYKKLHKPISDEKQRIPKDWNFINAINENDKNEQVKIIEEINSIIDRKEKGL